MRKSVIINIPEPCHEDWNKMTPKNQGRHCDACQKTVIDFSTKTDEQVIKTIESTGNLCGRFKTQQLNREIVLTRKDKNNYLSWAASGLFAFMALGSQEANAKGLPRTVQTDSIKVAKLKGKVATSIFNKRKISGIISSSSDSLPLPGVSVIIKGTSKGVQTDFDGKFSIEIKEGQILEIRYLGYETERIQITRRTNNILKINLENSITGNIVSVSLGGAVGQWVRVNDSEDFISPEEVERKIKRRKVSHQRWKDRNKANRVKWRNERLVKREAIKNGEQKRTAFGKFFFGIKSLFLKK